MIWYETMHLITQRERDSRFLFSWKLNLQSDVIWQYEKDALEKFLTLTMRIYMYIPHLAKRVAKNGMPRSRLWLPTGSIWRPEPWNQVVEFKDSCFAWPHLETMWAKGSPALCFCDCVASKCECNSYTIVYNCLIGKSEGVKQTRPWLIHCNKRDHSNPFKVNISVWRAWTMSTES